MRHGQDMESLHFRFENGRIDLDPARAPRLVGVVGSGNLEVLIEAAHLKGGCEIGIDTAARGFADTWQAVMEDFQQRWQLRDARISINDMGATPAVVSLRLDQAVEAVNGPSGTSSTSNTNSTNSTSSAGAAAIASPASGRTGASS